jgi:hypothetical protein
MRFLTFVSLPLDSEEVVVESDFPSDASDCGLVNRLDNLLLDFFSPIFVDLAS